MSEAKTQTATYESGGKPITEVTTTNVKAGIKTTEFWISLAAAVASFALAQGFITDDQVGNVVAVIGPVVAAFGYSISRGLAKK